MTAPEEIQILSDRLILRNFRTSDIDNALAIVGDDRVTTSLSFQTKDRPATESMIQSAISSSLDIPRKEYYLAVAEKSTDQVIGFIRLASSGIHSAKLGYALRYDRWGQGFASEAARAMCVYGFKSLGIHRVTAATAPDNKASRLLLERIGFVPEGRLRDHVHTNGSWRDSLLYSLLATDRLE